MPDPTESSTSLREQMCRHELALYQVAAASSNPAIQRAALRSAKAERRQRHRSEALIAPRTALFLCLLVWMSWVIACWYALVHYELVLALRITVTVLFAAIMATLTCLTFSRHILAGDLVNFLKAVWDKVAFWNSPDDKVERQG